MAVQDLERHMATEHGVFGIENAAHPALAELANNGEVIESAADSNALATMGAGDLAVGFQDRDVNDAFAGGAGAEICLGVL